MILLVVSMLLAAPVEDPKELGKYAGVVNDQCLEAMTFAAPRREHIKKSLEMSQKTSKSLEVTPITLIEDKIDDMRSLKLNIDMSNWTHLLSVVPKPNLPELRRVIDFAAYEALAVIGRNLQANMLEEKWRANIEFIGLNDYPLEAKSQEYTLETFEGSFSKWGFCGS
jgi:hypothetical protein